MVKVILTPKVEIQFADESGAYKLTHVFDVNSPVAFNFLWASIIASVWNDSGICEHHFRVSLETLTEHEELPDSDRTVINVINGIKVGSIGDKVYASCGNEDIEPFDITKALYNVIEPLFHPESVSLSLCLDDYETKFSHGDMDWQLFENMVFDEDSFESNTEFLLISSTGLICALELDSATDDLELNSGNIWSKFNDNLDKNFPGWTSALVEKLKEIKCSR